MTDTTLRRSRRRRITRRTTILVAVPVLAMASLTLSSFAVNGNIGSAAIEIDANLYPSSGGTDWVKDSTGNVGTGCLVGSIASCNEAGVTAAATGVGHWNGARIVDGIAGNDSDIFLTGGKENDTSTWNVGPGTVGSSKYDATQAYLANNATTLFFGMERRGNNGTTAFDFEFNRVAPATSTTYVPTRSAGDKLFTFEMSGSGSSGSAVPHVYTFTNGVYVEGSSAGVATTINNAPIPAAPWGFVNSHGSWTTGNLDNFMFAEASVNLATVFAGTFDPCSTAPYYTQVRTRSAATATSDLKDTTKIFSYNFTASAAPTASKTSASATNMSATLTGVSDSGTTKQWQKTTSLTTNPVAWSNITGATAATLVYTGFDSDVAPATAPVVAFSSGTSVSIANTTNANGSYVGRVQTVFFRLRATTTTSCTSFSTPVTVHKVQLIDP